MSVMKFVQPKIHNMTGGLFANWMPNNFVSVGDFGALQRCAFERLGNLQDFGTKIDVESIEGGNNNLEFKSFATIEPGFSVLASDGLSDVDASVAVQFKSRGAFLYHLSEVDQNRPANMKLFHEHVAKALLCGVVDFPDDGVLVTEVQKAKKASIVVSDSKSGTLELKTKFELEGEAFLSGAKGKISVGASTGSLFQWIGNEDTVALIRLVRPVFPSPPDGPGKSEGVVKAVVKWVRDLVGGRKLHVSELQLKSYVDDGTPSLVFGVAETKHEIKFSFAETTVSELLKTDDEGEEGGEKEIDGIEIEEVAYKRRSPSTAVG